MKNLPTISIVSNINLDIESIAIYISIYQSFISYFSNFWGAKSELRRFPDGSIHEAVVWSVPLQHSHIIIRKIAVHLLGRHCQIHASGVTCVFKLL